MIFFGDFIKPMEVYTKMKIAILFLYDVLAQLGLKAPALAWLLGAHVL